MDGLIGLRSRDPGDHAGDRPIQGLETYPAVTNTLLHPLCGLDAVALRHGRSVRSVYSDLGLQRPPVDRALGMGIRARAKNRGAQAGASRWAARYIGLSRDRRSDLEPDSAWREHQRVGYERILGEPYFVVRSTPTEDGDSRSLVEARTLRVRKDPFVSDSLMSRVRETFADIPISEVRLLEGYDSYHYSRDRLAPLPILRVKFADPAGTWLYIDPVAGRLSGSLHRLERVERWIYHGFHSLDFAFWYYNRPAWDIGIILLSLGGLATSAIGLFVGTRRLWRG
jgi:hypothetical protein